MGRTREGSPNKKRYVTMRCPADRCESGNGYRLTATVPGMKRHVKAVHGEALNGRVKWPNIYGEVSGSNFFFFKLPEGSLALKSLNELRQEAKRRGVSPLGKSKKALAIELSNFDLARRARSEAAQPELPFDP